MARAPCTFRQRDVAAALRAVRDAGYEVARVEISKDGKIVVVPSKPVMSDNNDDPNEWDAAT
jgi:hypothetical protein